MLWSGLSRPHRIRPGTDHLCSVMPFLLAPGLPPAALPLPHACGLHLHRARRHALHAALEGAARPRVPLHAREDRHPGRQGADETPAGTRPPRAAAGGCTAMLMHFDRHLPMRASRDINHDIRGILVPTSLSTAHVINI